MKAVSTPGSTLWEGRGALGYLTLAAICDDLEADSAVARQGRRRRGVLPHRACSGYWVRRLANAGLAALLTATSPARLAHPDGGAPLVGTNPLAIGLPSADGDPIVVDVSMGKVTHGDVLRGVATPSRISSRSVASRAHKAFALAVGLQGWVESFVGDGYGAVLVVARPAHDEFVPDAPAARGRSAPPGRLVSRRGPRRAGDREALDHACRNLASTTGSIRSSSLTRSSRFSTPAQSASVA